MQPSLTPDGEQPSPPATALRPQTSAEAIPATARLAAGLALLVTEPGVGHYGRHLWAVLASQGDYGVVFASREAVEHATGMTSEQLRRAVRDLDTRGWLELQPAAGTEDKHGNFLLRWEATLPI